MAHFAKLDEQNIVVSINVINNNILLDDNGIENEQKGIDFLIQWSNGHTNWKQTSYNTYGGIHRNNGIPLRKNYACIGFTYDPIRDAFIPPKPDVDCTFDENTCLWLSPTLTDYDT